MQFPQRSMKLVTARLGCHVDDGAAMPAILRVEGLRQNADLRQLVQAEKKPGSARGRITEDRIRRIHAIDQNVRHTRTYPINRHLPGLTARKQRRTTAGVGSDSGLQRNRTKEIAVVEGQVRQALLWNESLDGRRRAVNGGSVRADVRLLRKVADRELGIYGHIGRRSEFYPSANLRLEPGLLHAERIRSRWQAGETVSAGRVSKSAPFQSSALARNRNADAGDNGATGVSDGPGNSRKLGLRPCTY